MATDDDHQATKASEFQKKLDVMVAAADVKKRYDATHARVLAATTLLEEEEERAAAVLIEEACATAATIKPPSPTPPLAPVSCAAPLDNDYEVDVIANIHV
jgi:hypothetical protein